MIGGKASWKLLATASCFWKYPLPVEGLWCRTCTYFHRNPKSSDRPTFDDAMRYLLSPKDKLLKWSVREKAVHLSSCHLGADLEVAENLHKDLRELYLLKRWMVFHCVTTWDDLLSLATFYVKDCSNQQYLRTIWMDTSMIGHKTPLATSTRGTGVANDNPATRTVLIIETRWPRFRGPDQRESMVNHTHSYQRVNTLGDDFLLWMASAPNKLHTKLGLSVIINVCTRKAI